MSNPWPQIELLTFLPFLTLQAALLHPIFPSTPSRILRLLLTPFTLYYALTGPFHYGFVPREKSVVFNFIIGVMGVYASWKGLEWGTVGGEDVRKYTWVGFEGIQALPGMRKGKGKETNRAATNGSSSTPTTTFNVISSSDLQTLRTYSATHDTPLEIITYTFHLLSSMRGHGWAFGPTPPSSISKRVSLTEFFWTTLRDLVWSHALLLGCGLVLCERKDRKIEILSGLLGDLLSSDHLELLSETLTGLSLGIGAFGGLQSGYLTASLLMFFSQTFLHHLPLPTALRPPEFDPRQYENPFDSPWAPTSVGRFWGSQWHDFFSPSFKYLAYNPAFRLGKIIGGKSLGKILGVMSVFGLSAFLHEQALWSSTYGLEIPRNLPPPTNFFIKWGGSVYFLAQGIAIILENIYTQTTGRKVRGIGGFLWALPWMGGLGCLVYLSWTSQGLLMGLPEPSAWAWQRWVIPVGCFAPGALWIK